MSIDSIKLLYKLQQLYDILQKSEYEIRVYTKKFANEYVYTYLKEHEALWVLENERTKLATEIKDLFDENYFNDDHVKGRTSFMKNAEYYYSNKNVARWCFGKLFETFNIPE